MCSSGRRYVASELFPASYERRNVEASEGNNKRASKPRDSWKACDIPHMGHDHFEIPYGFFATNVTQFHGEQPVSRNGDNLEDDSPPWQSVADLQLNFHQLSPSVPDVQHRTPLGPAFTEGFPGNEVLFTNSNTLSISFQHSGHRHQQPHHAWSNLPRTEFYNQNTGSLSQQESLHEVLVDENYHMPHNSIPPDSHHHTFTNTAQAALNDNVSFAPASVGASHQSNFSLDGTTCFGYTPSVNLMSGDDGVGFANLN